MIRSIAEVATSAHPPKGASQSHLRDFILALGWDSPKAFKEFKMSPEHQQLVTSLGINLDKAHTRIMVFEDSSFSYGLTSDAEIICPRNLNETAIFSVRS